jgi:multiple sugar transport system substrate-binding protein
VWTKTVLKIILSLGLSRQYHTSFPEQAKELANFLGSAEAQEIWVRQGGFLGPNLTINRNIYSPIAQKELDLSSKVTIVPGIGDSIGGEFQTTLWDQLKLLWAEPNSLDQVLEAIQKKASNANQTKNSS